MPGPGGSLTTISASSGWVYSTSTSAITTEHIGFVVVGDSVVTAWTAVDGQQTIDLFAMFNLSGITLTSDFPALIIPANMTSVSLTLSTNGGICLLKG